MDEAFKAKWRENAKRYQRSLERIAEKYSKLQDGCDSVEVDLNTTSIGALVRYMKQSMKNVDEAESVSFAEKSLEDITSDSELDHTCQEQCGDIETTSLSDGDVTQNDGTSLTIGPVDQHSENYSLIADQPEDQDAELNVSLQTNSSSMGELYPDMVSQIEKAWRRQHVSEAADSVRRRYQRWHKSNQVHRSSSFHTVQRDNEENGRRDLFNKQHHTPKSPAQCGSSIASNTTSQSPVNVVTTDGQKSQNHCSPVRHETSAVAMDMPAIYKENERFLKKTLTVSEPSLLYSTLTTSPSRSCYSPSKPVQDFTFRKKESGMSPVGMKDSSMSPRRMKESGSSPRRMKESVLSLWRMKESGSSPRRMKESGSSPWRMKESGLSPWRMKESGLSPRRVQTSSSSVLGSTLFKEICSSPVRASPSKAKMTERDIVSERSDICDSPLRRSPFMLHKSRESPQKSPYAPVASPNSPNMKHSFSRDLRRSISASNFVLSPPKHAAPRRMLEYPDQRQRSPQLPKPGQRDPGLRGRLSFDSTQPLSRSSYSSKDLDEDFMKHYHKLVCLSKSFLKSHPCRFCAKNADVSPGSSSSLAALALSPHRPLLRKRYGDVRGYPHSKRFKDGRGIHEH